nr:ATP-binding protein [Hasllibacter sp. MH4015]
MLFRFYANQLVQQTEESLLMQASVLAATYEQVYRVASDLPELADAPIGFAPLFPSVTMNPQAILSPRPDPLPATEAIGPAYAQIAPLLSRIADNAQEQTLAGYRFIDRFGTVIAGSAEVGTYLGHVQEVALALNGETVSVPRTRVRQGRERAIYALSQGSRVRIFVAMPVFVEEDLIGVVYLSRTPNHIFRFLYSERLNLFGAALFVLISTGLIGFVFWRFISRPLHALIARTETFGATNAEWDPLEHYGTREIETLAQSFGTLANRLQRQQTSLKTYTAHVSHEMKSPLTSIKGAAELMQDADMSPEQRAVFLDNIGRDSARMEHLLARMREYSAVGQLPAAGTCRVSAVLAAVESPLDVRLTGADETLPISAEALTIILHHLVENAAAHGATRVDVRAGKGEDEAWITVSDNGSGVSAGNRDRIFEPFFTSRRAEGGTGMGLSIVRSVVEQSGGTIALVDAGQGAAFRIAFAV